MCSPAKVSKAPPTPTHSNTNRPEKCWIPICRVWVVEAEEEIEVEQGKEREEERGRQSQRKEEWDEGREEDKEKQSGGGEPHQEEPEWAEGETIQPKTHLSPVS